MAKKSMLFLFLFLFLFIFCTNYYVLATEQEFYSSPFTGQAVEEFKLKKAIMVSVENSPQARPQYGLDSAAIIYEFLVEGGITRFLALYWDLIPEKIGPVRSLRPYMIEIASEYKSLLLHAGASPAAFALLEQGKVEHLDQIYNGRYYWRGTERKAPHNLYTGALRIEDYLRDLTGQEYENRFPFQYISIIDAREKRARKIVLEYWGGYTVYYLYNPETNNYQRFLESLQQPHLSATGQQLTADNIIVQFVKTEVVDSVGRLAMELNSQGKALVFRDGVVIPAYWVKKDNNWTEYYNEDGELINLNPGQTWIQIVPQTANIFYEE